MSRAPDHATFIAALRREVAAYAEFVALLREEQQHLTQAEIEPIAGLARKKEDKVEELHALARLRRAFLEAHSLQATPSGMEQWIQSQAGGPAKELRDLWEHLSVGADEAKRLNRTNGRIISSRLSHNREALTALSGLTRSVGVYGRDGHTTVGVTHRHFGAF